jgi:hypothetical protein
MAKALARKRPKLVPVSEEMRRVSVLLGQELLRWPGVSVRSMFGLRAFYRGAVVFAMLPDKRALKSPKAIAYKLLDRPSKREGEKWRSYELKNEFDINNALAHLDQAYKKAQHASSR